MQSSLRALQLIAVLPSGSLGGLTIIRGLAVIIAIEYIFPTAFLAAPFSGKIFKLS
jgi:hypothetical protein